MSWWQALILGLVEGVTEFLPVSSTGHLILAERVLGIPADDNANAYAICIQAGAILAVLLVYRERLLAMAKGVVGADPQGRRLLLMVLAAFVPAAVLGPVLDHPIERVLFGLWPVVFAWAAGGVGIVLFSRWSSERKGGEGIESVDLRRALLIGLAQCVAMWPGTSRSLVTIVAAALLGLSLPAAVEFSFLLGLVTLGAATCYEGLKHGQVMLHAYGPLPLALGFLAAGLSAFASARWMVAHLSRRGLAVFGYWRLAAAAIVSVLILTRVLDAG